jgi:5-hydroxyisourate hydrolase
MSISTRILDSTSGRPAAGVRVKLEHAVNSDWTCVATTTTGPDGWVGVWGRPPRHLERGAFRLRYDTNAYFAELGVIAFYSEISVVFALADSERCDVTLLIAPHSYVIYGGT